MTKKKARKLKARPAPEVPEYAIWTDEIKDSFMFAFMPYSAAEKSDSYDAAVRAAEAKVRQSDRVRLVGIYKLVAKVRPDRSPVTVMVEETR